MEQGTFKTPAECEDSFSTTITTPGQVPYHGGAGGGGLTTPILIAAHPWALGVRVVEAKRRENT